MKINKNEKVTAENEGAAEQHKRLYGYMTTQCAAMETEVTWRLVFFFKIKLY